MMDATVHTLDGQRIEPISTGQAVERFMERLRLRGYANNTLATYGASLRSLVEWLESRDITLLALISERMVDGWLDHLARSGNSARSQANKMATLRSFLAFAKREGWLQHDPAQEVRLKFRAGQVIAPELDRLLAVISAIPHATPADIRDRAMLRLGLDAALRISEVAGLDLADGTTRHCVDLKRLHVRVQEKGGGTGVCGINTTTADAVRAWLAVRDRLAKPDESALFVSRLGRRITRQQLHNIIRNRGRAAGIEGLHWHLLRHRRVGNIVEQCGLEVGQKVARHSDKSTTANIYGAHAAELVRAIVRDRCDLDRMGAGA